MIQRWQKKKTQLPLIAILFFLFILCTIFYNERRFQEIHRKENRKPDNIATRNDVKKTFSSLNRQVPPGILDRFTTCNSTIKYNGRLDLNTPLLQSDEQENMIDSCNVFSGRWVFDNVSFPLYNESACPYMSDQLACHKHGRPDLMYQNWRWQPHGCDLKRWNATEMWDKLRGKRLMFVGDSLNRGQWISMLCLLESVIPAEKKSITPNAPLTIFRAEEYNATVEFQWAPLMVESNSDDPVNHRLDERIIRPDSVVRHASEWAHVDIFVISSAVTVIHPCRRNLHCLSSFIFPSVDQDPVPDEVVAMAVAEFNHHHCITKISAPPRNGFGTIGRKCVIKKDLHYLKVFVSGRHNDNPRVTIQALDVVLRESASIG